MSSVEWRAMLPIVCASLLLFGFVAPPQVRTSMVYTEQPDLLLYYSPDCTFCQKVLQHLASLQKMVPLKSIHKDKAAKKELKKIGGKAQVPCLIINGKALYESDAIIQWLSQHQHVLDPQ